MTRVLVVGDVLLDRDLMGRVERLCPDAPVPVVDQDRVVERPGGAGLAAVLAAAQGAEVALLCALAPDDGGHRLRSLLHGAGVEVLDCGLGGTTVEKVRVRAAGQSLVRIDRGTGAVPHRLPERAASAIGSADVVLVADYGHGLTAHRPVRDALASSRARGTPSVWDPHPRGSEPVPDTTLVTPNLREAARFSDADGADAAAQLSDHVRCARALRARWGCAAVAVTLGESGALLVTGDGAPLVVPVEHPVQAGDTCGAGDAFAAATAVALGGGALLSEAVQAGVQRATEHVANAMAPLEREVTAVGSASERSGGTLVATGGCFDLLHPGHVSTLERARRLGDRLVVLLNSDASVQRLKGPGRPVQDEHDRAAVLRSLSCVDEVVVFDEDTPVEALRRLRPEVFVKGGDYSAATLPEAQVLAEWGGEVVTVPFVAGRSTTGLLQRIDGNGAVHVG